MVHIYDIMEVKISIAKDNKERILNLISELVDAEDDKIKSNNSQDSWLAPKATLSSYLGIPENFDTKLLVQPKLEKSLIGSWFMFNSFFVGKAMLRVLANALNREKMGYIDVDILAQLSYDCFKSAELSKYRGFPKDKKHHKYEKSNIDKLKYFVLTPFADMGLIMIKDDENDKVFLTNAGLDFLNLKNPVLDEHKQFPNFSKLEQKFIINYLKSINTDYKEYSVLKETAALIRTKKDISYQDIVAWFEKNSDIIDYLYDGSRAQKENKSKNDKDFKSYLHHAAQSFASSRIALLRELGTLSDKRGEYKIISNDL